VRSVVLAGGLVIGLGSSVAGAVAGIGVAAALRPLLTQLEVAYLPTLAVRPLELLALVAVGTGTAVAAALLPAVQASRHDVVAALGGRRGQTRVRRWVPLTGAVVAAAGTVAAVGGAVARVPLVVLAGAVLAELGLVAMTGALVAGAARFSGTMPVSARIAVRDAARQRSRTAPAVAAVMTAVAGSVAVSLFLTAQDTRSEEAYVAAAPMGSVLWSGYLDPLAEDGVTALAAETERAADVMRRELPVQDVSVFATIQAEGRDALHVLPEVAPEHVCPEDADPVITEAGVAATGAGPRCTGAGSFTPAYNLGPAVVDDGTSAAALVVDDADAVRTALSSGSAVVGSADLLWPDGTAHVRLERYPATGGTPLSSQDVVLPAVVADLSATEVILPPSALEGLDVEAVPTAVFASTTTAPDEASVERATALLADADVSNAYIYVERGYTSSAGLGLLALAAAAALVTLGATGIAVGLAAADSRADLATLAAVGASPRVRRRVAGAQAAVVSVLGVLLGVVAGAVLGVVVVLMARHGAAVTDETWRVVVPWPQLGALVVGVPALAVAAGYAFTRSRLPMVRRVGQ
jgi:putative ABC transport system permease protein